MHALDNQYSCRPQATEETLMNSPLSPLCLQNHAEGAIH